MGRLGRVGPYTLLERLGRGGMGEVYLASSRRGDNVALKVLHDVHDAGSEARVRLEREVRALRRVESPYVARVVDADLDGDRPYLVMEHIEGDTLLERVRRDGPLEGAGLLSVAQGLAVALSIIHAAGVVHRDLKPANVVVGGDDEPVLIDFGIAHVLDATRLTLTGTFLGTPGYAAPRAVRRRARGRARRRARLGGHRGLRRDRPSHLRRGHRRGADVRDPQRPGRPRRGPGRPAAPDPRRPPPRAGQAPHRGAPHRPPGPAGPGDPGRGGGGQETVRSGGGEARPGQEAGEPLQVRRQG
ncbi:serine/threonine-protein kinase [Streptosporangium vulgare]|uniref:serine/threonine-protein kinase n=1 Tax=Streptosporangium vulgare TaxID=46190 RepID=UPI0031DB5B5E